MENSLEKNKQKFSVVFNAPTMQKLIASTLKDSKRIARYTAAICSAVAINADLQKCEATSIVTASLLGESLNLSPSPQLGQYYMVPFWNNKKQTFEAQFIPGYKGYIQLAIRSGQYSKLNVLPIKDGELISWNPLTEDLKIKINEDALVRESLKTIGYYVMFEYINGFRKALYWTKEKMLAHADKYAQAFSLKGEKVIIRGKNYNRVSYADYKAGKYNINEEWLYSSNWYKDFDAMACKTMLRQIISKWGIMSPEMISMFENDGETINEDLQADKTNYVDASVEAQTEVAKESGTEQIPMQQEAVEVTAAPKQEQVSQPQTEDYGF